LNRFNVLFLVPPQFFPTRYLLLTPFLRGKKKKKGISHKLAKKFREGETPDESFN
jgi:hypothetical protein